VVAIAHPMPRNVAIIGSIVLAFGAVEALAWWWTHPTPAGLGQPVLVYQPKGGSQKEGKAAGQRTEAEGQQLPSENLSSIQNPKFRIQNPFSSSITPLPEIVANSQPSLRCSTGTAARIDREDGVTIHLAFFEWDLADTRDVLEAYKHLPEQCLGAIGMKLVENRPVRTYQVGTETIAFDHSVFRDRAGVLVHSFKGVWVSGMSRLVGDGFPIGGDQWRNLRWKAALHRFHPAYSRVAQGAVRGIPNPDLAWQAFNQAMLNDLHFETR
jgi:hypothetical protein